MFFGKDIVNINADNTDESFNLLLDQFDEIYDYNLENQYKRFVERLLLADKELGVTGGGKVELLRRSRVIHVP